MVVLGGPVPEALRQALRENIDILPEGHASDDGVAGVLVHASPGALAAVRRFRMDGGQLAIYGLSGQAVTVSERIAWIREGADDLLTLENAAEVLVRRLRGPPSRGPGEGVPPSVRVDRYLSGLARYLGLRTELEVRLGSGGLARLLECQFQRDQAMRAADTEIPVEGAHQRRTGDREQIRWTATLVPSGEEVELLNVGPDGVGVVLSYDPEPGSRLQLEVEGLDHVGTLEGEVRWRRQTGRDRWEAGLLTRAIQVRAAR